MWFRGAAKCVSGVVILFLGAHNFHRGYTKLILRGSYVSAELIAVSEELQSGSVELRRGFKVLKNVSVEFRFCFKVFGICFAKLRNCFTELICIGKELSGVSMKLETGLETGSARP